MFEAQMRAREAAEQRAKQVAAAVAAQKWEGRLTKSGGAALNAFASKVRTARRSAVRGGGALSSRRGAVACRPIECATQPIV